ncbi:MAG: serine/threonine-protein kinase [Polyangiaceae bacterium]
MRLSAGSVVAPGVRLVRALATRGVTSVWLAEHEAFGRVAVKLLTAPDPELVERFSLEAALTGALQNAHSVRLLERGKSAQGLPYLVLELLEGEPLKERLAREPQLPLETTATIVAQIAEALGEAHARGIVHRDVKPANLFVCEDERGLHCKLIDFGVAKRLGAATDELTADGNLVGTPVYMSPEQLLYSNRLTIQADLWSLAVVAYRCLAGVLPFDAESRDELCLAVFASRFTPILERRPDLPRTADMFFTRAFRKKIDHRYPDAATFADAFAELVSHAVDYGDEAETSPVELTAAQRAAIEDER